VAVTAEPVSVAVAPEPKAGRPPGSLRFDWLMLVVGIWPVIGAEYDAYTHINTPKLETFFTPAHATLYSGVAAVGFAMALVVWRNHARGYAWTRAIPAGYGLTLLGVAILAVAGIGDLIWHTLFGIEQNIPAIVSPTHMLIVVGILLIVTGPWRAAAARPTRATRWREQWPLALSALFTLTMITIVLQFLNPLSYRFAAVGERDLFADPPFPAVDSFLADGLGLAGVLATTVIVMAIVLPLVRRWRLFPGALALILAGDALLLAATQGAKSQDLQMVPAAFAAGLAGDLLLLALRPSENRAAFHVFAFALPVLYFAAYFAALTLFAQVAWIVHFWVGAIFVAGVVGLGLSLLMPPDAIAARAGPDAATLPPPPPPARVGSDTP